MVSESKFLERFLYIKFGNPLLKGSKLKYKLLLGAHILLLIVSNQESLKTGVLYAKKSRSVMIKTFRPVRYPYKVK